MIILWNTVMLFLDDPYSDNDVGNMFDTFFQSWYTFEMSFKIFALGFLFNEDSYLRNVWNILDFFIVVTGFLPYVVDTRTVKLSGLRTLRVLRPLKTISSLKHLKLILMSLFSAMPMILNAVFILFFLLLIYAIAALQLFMGTLKRRCFDKGTGLILSQNFDSSYNGYLCGYNDCPQPDVYICGKQLSTPNSSVTNFDTVLWCLLMMFQEITLENWSINMYYVARTFSYYIVFFFLSLAFIGAMIFLNLLASIISQAYEKQQVTFNEYTSSQSLNVHEEKELPISLEDIRRLKRCEHNHHIRMDRRLNRVSTYGVHDNYVFVPRPDDMRWQDILDLKLQRLTEKPKTIIQTNNIKEQAISDVDDLLNYLDDTYLKGGEKLMTETEVHTERKRKSNADIKAMLSSKFHETIKVESNSNEIGSGVLPRKSRINLANGLRNEKVMEKIMKESGNTKEKDEAEFEEKNEVNISKFNVSVKKEKPFEFSEKIEQPEEQMTQSKFKHYSSLAMKTISKIKMFSRFLKKSTSIDKKQENYKVIDYMLMVDFSKFHSFESEADVMVNRNIRQKQMEHILLEQKLRNCKCALKYKTNLIDISELHSKQIKKQTRIMTQLPMFGKGNRMENPEILKKLLYGKNLSTSFKVPIGGCHNFFIIAKWRKKQKKEATLNNISSIHSMFSVKKKRTKAKQRPQRKKKEKTMVYQYKDLKYIVKENILREEIDEEAFKSFTNEEDYMNIKVLFFDLNFNKNLKLILFLFFLNF